MATKKALVIGASGGIGHALGQALAQNGTQVTTLSRATDGLDITEEASISTLLNALDQTFDRVIVATGVLHNGSGPEKHLRMLSGGQMAEVFAVNAIGPALVLKHVQRLLPKDRPAVFAALSARVGSIGDNALGGWYSYRASKAALNQIIKTGAVELARTHRNLACVALHPGTVATEFTRNYPNHEKAAPKAAATQLLSVLDSLTAADSGRFLDWAGKDVPW